MTFKALSYPSHELLTLVIEWRNQEAFLARVFVHLDHRCHKLFRTVFVSSRVVQAQSLLGRDLCRSHYICEQFIALTALTNYRQTHLAQVSIGSRDLTFVRMMIDF